ncbi:unnamed protein product [Acanthoscelides obtectus]|uniref:Uncharacterized protein n=1 Tax=Acanthoscelides obtectus TaxID=200917 RepID=A0A9P0M7G5_ACAOB|nr:unnamed protein product [Acanthoscelides obtectus]CAK1622548.1 hypothetical protein AOBTE_LOCUS1556 [Acanthoscelides obtectus]
MYCMENIRIKGLKLWKNSRLKNGVK